MWWVNRFGSVTGPFSQEQIDRLIRNNQLTRLHKVSRDRTTWIRVDQSELWAPKSLAPEEMELPSLPMKSEVEESAPKFSAIHELPEKTAPEIQAEVAISPRREARKSIARVLFLSIGLPIIIFISFLMTVTVVGPAVKTYIQKAHARARELEAESADAKESSDDPTSVSFDQVKSWVALIKTADGSGTGFLVRMDGKVYLVSNEHVLRSVTDPEVTLVDGTRIRLGAFSIAEDRDLARYEVDYTGDCFELSDTVPNNGETIWTYGNSMGDGVITSLEGKVTGVGAMWLKVSASFVPGNSGSPIVTSDGKVVAVASFIVNGKLDSNFTTKGTEFDEARRFGIRFTNVRWKSIDPVKYKLECGRYEAFCTYWRYLYPFLICLDVEDEKLKKLYLDHEEIDRKAFGGEDYGFHEMLMGLAKSYAGQGRSWRRWLELLKRRDDLIRSLDKDVEQGKRSLEDARAILNRFDQEREVDRRWTQVKENHRDFNAKRKEALMMAQSFLKGVTWQDPMMMNGDESYKRWSITWFLDQIQLFLDSNAQDLKNLNKALNSLEKGDEDEE